MRKLLLAAALAAGGVASSAGVAGAQPTHFGPSATSVTWPCVTPPGWYTNTYNHAWYFPWYAYYNSSDGPYANWMAGGGYASYANCGPAGHFYYPREVAQPYRGVWYREPGAPRAPGAPGAPAAPGAGGAKDVKKEDKKDEKADEKKEMKDEMVEGRVSITLPTDAKLLFNGTAAAGTGAVRTFRTPALQPGQSYRYELTAEVVRDGRTERVTESVVVRAGETATVTLTPTGVTTASK